MAVDAAVMVVDSAKGIEAQTKKFSEVVKHRGIPVFTFMNKLTVMDVSHLTSWKSWKKCLVLPATQ